jgi:hypothetical protein
MPIKLRDLFGPGCWPLARITRVEFLFVRFISGYGIQNCTEGLPGAVRSADALGCGPAIARGLRFGPRPEKMSSGLGKECLQDTPCRTELWRNRA